MATILCCKECSEKYKIDWNNTNLQFNLCEACNREMTVQEVQTDERTVLSIKNPIQLDEENYKTLRAQAYKTADYIQAISVFESHRLESFNDEAIEAAKLALFKTIDIDQLNRYEVMLKKKTYTINDLKSQYYQIRKFCDEFGI